MGWKKKIEESLRKLGPVQTGELILSLGFDCGMTMLDVQTQIGGMENLNGSFEGSQAQRVFGNMVDDGQVEWQRSVTMDNWYKLPDQKFPPQASPRMRTLKQIMKELFKVLPQILVYRNSIPIGDICNYWKQNVEAIGRNDAWVEFCPFVLTMHEDGWELADGDSICNWAGNTFTEVYPMDVDVNVIAGRIEEELEKDHNKELLAMGEN